ncbi:MAG: hypothetical protein JXM69_13120 [Anaerolineae bacterium]|nr:hypothetical protein [Anaerolineae bacterium]
MGQMRYIVDLNQPRLPASVGNKAKNLRDLMRKGFPVPQTHVCTWDAFVQYRQGEVAIMDHLKTELAQRLDGAQCYAVRSSANIEDSLEHSFAGQFKSILNVRSLNNIVQSIGEIWETTHADHVQTYLARISRDPQELKMAVMVQEMVEPVCSGVSFSKNPMTGMDEVVVEAVEGCGEALVQEGVTPYRWVYKWDKWISLPEECPIDADLIQQVVSQTQTIAKTFNKDVDLEWVYDGQALHWVQIREITSIKHVNVYSNAIAKEQLPGMIKPLVWSINIPLVNGAWVKILTEIIGKNDIDPQRLAKSFYYRAYYNMGALGQIFESLGMPRESLEIMMGLGGDKTEKPKFKPNATMLKLTPRILRFLLDKWTFSRKIDAFLPVIEAEFKAFSLEPSPDLSEQELLNTIDRLFGLTQQAAYYNIVGPLLMHIYNGLLRSQFKKQGLDFESLDLTRGMTEFARVDPTMSLKLLGQQFAEINENTREKILAGTYQELQQLPNLEDFQQGIADFIDHFGHLSDSGNDFSVAPWRENPALILQLLPSYTHIEEAATEPINPADFPVSGLRRRWLNTLYRRARQFRLYRERINFIYTYGYGLFRDYFLALGQRLTQQEILKAPTDIFYLDHQEVRELITRKELTPRYQQWIAARKHEMENFRDIVLPGIIYGDDTPSVDLPSDSKLTGTPTSRGYYSGPVKVVRGINDFAKLENGDVLVVPYSDVGWTPLFAKAGAVISESGGMLSHSSIIAREYNIPAVVSVAEATRLADHTQVTIDGYKGEILIHNSGDSYGSSGSATTS